MELYSWFQKGMSAQDYVESMEVNQDTLLSIYQSYQLSELAQQITNKAAIKGIKAIVLTADWCGDAMVNVPIFLKLAHNSVMDVRFLIRDENLELMDQYLTNGKARSIPIFIFFNKEGKELAKWGPRATQIEEKIAALKKALPEQGTDNYKQAFHDSFIPKTRELFKEPDTWKTVEADLLNVFKRIG